MAVEDDPRYQRWRSALETMIAMRETAFTVRHLPVNDPVRMRAEADFKAAQQVYRAIADEV